jgi:hypothetical protein
LGPKPLDLAPRLGEARRISELLAATPGFSFVRVGDTDVTLLLAMQEQIDGSLEPRWPVNGTTAFGNSGIDLRHGERLKRALERASYVDFHDRLWPISELLPRLRLQRPHGLHRNPDAETSYIILTWLECEFKKYCRGRRVGFIGAEARLLQELLEEPRFREVSAPYWPSDAEIHLLQPRGDGANLDSTLDIIADDLRQWIRATGVDTVFVSLGGGAKILCAELAEELGVRMFDFGGSLRALTSSGSDGNRACRATHYPFLYHVPFETWSAAAERAFRGLPEHELLAKLHAQLILEVQAREIGWTHASWELDLSRSNRQAFRRAHAIYRAKYRHLFRKTPETRRERAGFLHFCGTHGLTWEGRRFLTLFRIKSALARARRLIPR